MSARFLWKFSIARLLNLACFMFELSHVFRRLAIETDLSADALFAGLTCKSLQIITTSLINDPDYDVLKLPRFTCKFVCELSSSLS